MERDSPAILPPHSPQTDAQGQAQHRWRPRAVVTLCAMVVTLPLVLRGASCGHDFDFHLQSWLSAAQDWSHGTLYPHWLEAANYGAGEPRFVFYPPLTWILGALLGVALPWSFVPALFTFLLLAASGLSMELLAREYLPVNSATVAACAYILGPYTLFIAYERTAYGELAAAIWLPLLVLYAFRAQPNTTLLPPSEKPAIPNAAHSTELPPSERPVLLSEARSAESKDPPAPNLISLPLAAIISALWLTNAPAAVMACYLLAAITLWQTLTQKTARPVVRNASSLALGLGLCSFYLVPAAWERRWVEIARAVGPGMRVEDSFLFAHTGAPFHDQVLRTASWILVAMIGAIVVAGLAAWKKLSPSILLPVFIMTAIIAALQFPSSRLVWDHLPELKFLQFPWRLALVLSLVFAIVLGAAFSAMPVRYARRFSVVLVLAAATLASAIAAGHYWQPCDEEDAIAPQITVFVSGNGIEGTDEYTPLGADNSIVPQYQPPLRVLRTGDAETASGNPADDGSNPPYTPVPREEVPARIEIDQWRPEHKLVSIQSPIAAYAVFRLMDYPAWKIRVNHERLAARPIRDDGLIVVPLRSGVTEIEMNYAATADVLTGRALSTASLLVLLGIIYGRKRRRVGYHEANAS